MDLTTNLIFLVIFGVVGFVIGKFFGWNPYRIYTDGATIVVVLAIVFFMFPAVIDHTQALTIIERLPDFLLNILPGAIIGDIAGGLVAHLTGE